MMVYPINFITYIIWKIVADIWKLLQNINGSYLDKYQDILKLLGYNNNVILMRYFKGVFSQDVIHSEPKSVMEVTARVPWDRVSSKCPRTFAIMFWHDIKF
jgi:hypothetical protein